MSGSDASVARFSKRVLWLCGDEREAMLLVESEMSDVAAKGFGSLFFPLQHGDT
ncbi:hypothetical protein [Gluconobacter cerinus]|uniref:hypothetical protein n=1 Tax=Gluconobacter cerinus TaxID=38307 RepID=UPI002011E341|nr:hypothetical protein [Gluconobacter cerinus]